MNRWSCHIVAVSVFLLSLLAIPHSPVARAAPTTQTVSGFVIDHHSVAEFEQIPPEYLAAARNLRLLFSDRSVGQNISDALDCLTASSWVEAPANCRRDYIDATWNWKTFSRSDWESGNVPAAIRFSPNPTIYNRANWTFETRTGSWSELTQNFIQNLAPAYLNNKDILSYQFSYLNVDAGSDIASPTQGFFANNADRYDIHDLEAFWGQHPDKLFILWTTSLARGIGSQAASDFNNQMRQYAREHNMVLFDVADIEAHTPDGVPCYDNRDGVEYRSVSNGDSENYPTDNLNLPAICQTYTTETDGGHLGSVSAGKIQIAKAFWVLMARLAGWQGTGSPPSLPTSTAIPTVIPTATLTPNWTPVPMTPVPTASATPQPTATPQDSGAYIHVTDLNYRSTAIRQGWRASVQIAVGNDQDSPVMNVTVGGTWSNGYSGTAECVTNEYGRCTVVSGRISNNVSSVHFTINSLSHVLYPYLPSANHDEDANSSGGQTTVAAPQTYSTTGESSTRASSVENFTASSGSPVILTWTTSLEVTAGVVQFLIYRGDIENPDDAELITIPPLPAQTGLLDRYTFADATADPNRLASYWIVEVEDGQEIGEVQALPVTGEAASYQLLMPSLVR